MEQWYTLHTKSQQEARVAARLSELEIETLAPQVWQVDRAGVRRQVAYFPCYLFVSSELTSLPTSRWQWTPGLRHIVSFDGAPAVVPVAVIELIRSKVEELNRNQGAPRSRFRPGDPVRITKGPMADMAALFERECTPGERVSVLLDFLGRVCRVRVAAADLEELPAGAGSALPGLAQPATSRPPRRTRGHGRFIASH
jgi:transcriptional antiterminator RfaH